MNALLIDSPELKELQAQVIELTDYTTHYGTIDLCKAESYGFDTEMDEGYND